MGFTYHGVIVTCIILLSVLSIGEGLKCYRCTHAGATSTPCVTDPRNITGVNDMDCAGQCYSTRQVIKLTGQMYSVTRWCDADNTTKDVNQDTGSMLIRTRTCVTEYCNGEDLTYTPPSTLPTTTGTTTTSNPGQFSCYSCAYSDGQNRDCIDKPTEGRTVFCNPPNYCYTKRMDYVTKSGTFSFGRGCEVKTANNGCTKDANFNTCYTFCNSNNCNTGDGTYPTNPTKGPINGHRASNSPSMWIIASLTVALVAAIRS